MRIIVSESNDPFFNLAAEEFLLRNYTEDILYLYVNEPTVVVGKHQNLLSEINYRFIIENNIHLARRITGGGTVFHDLGNLNYAFFSASEAGTQVNFQKYLNWVILTLNRLGISANYEGKNNLCVDGYKISGNAGHVFKNVALHHGTLLVNANLSILSASINVEEGRYYDRAVKSIRAKVANLNQFIPDITIEVLINSFCEVLQCLPTPFSAAETIAIERLNREKFQSWSWIWGYSPFYVFHNAFSPWGSMELEVEKGFIVSARVENQPHWNRELLGLPHDYPSLLTFVKNQRLPINDIWWFF